MTEIQGHLGKMTWQEGPLALGDLPTTMLGGNGEGGFIGSKSIHGDVSTTVWTLGLLQLSRLIFLLEASEPWTQQRQPPSLPERMKSACAGQNAVTYYIMFKHHWQQIPDPVSVSKSEEGAVAAYSPPPPRPTPHALPFIIPEGHLETVVWLRMPKHTHANSKCPVCASIVITDAAWREKDTTTIKAPYCGEFTYSIDISINKVSPACQWASPFWERFILHLCWLVL